MPKTTKKAAEEARKAKEAENFDESTIGLEVGPELMEIYGQKTIMDRAMASIQDGLKPVQRRILYTMAELTLWPDKPPRKSSYTSGNTVARFHPHSSDAVYGSMANMVTDADPLIDHSGTNWGTLVDPVAAERYTECRLTEFARANYFNKEYLCLMRAKQNYDSSRTEPVYLPSITCGILVNGDFGLGVAKQCNLPSFSLESVNRLVEKAVTKFTATEKQLTAGEMAKILKFSFSWGNGAAMFVDDEKNWSEFERLIDTGKGTIRFEPEYEASEDLTELFLYGFPCSLQKTDRQSSKRVDAAAAIEGVKSMQETTSMDTESGYLVKFGKVDLADEAAVEAREELMWKVIGVFCTSSSYSVGYIDHADTEEADETTGLPIMNTTFKENSLRGMFYDWLDHRADLEGERLHAAIARIDEEMVWLDLERIAHEHRDTLDECRDQPDYRGWLEQAMAGLGYELEPEHVKFLLKMTVEKLTAIAKRDLDEEMQALAERRAELEAGFDNIEGLIIESVQALPSEM